MREFNDRCCWVVGTDPENGPTALIDRFNVAVVDPCVGLNGDNRAAGYGFDFMSPAYNRC